MVVYSRNIPSSVGVSLAAGHPFEQRIQIRWKKFRNLLFLYFHLFVFIDCEDLGPQRPHVMIRSPRRVEPLLWAAGNWVIQCGVGGRWIHKGKSAE